MKRSMDYFVWDTQFERWIDVRASVSYFAAVQHADGTFVLLTDGWGTIWEVENRVKELSVDRAIHIIEMPEELTVAFIFRGRMYMV